MQMRNYNQEQEMNDLIFKVCRFLLFSFICFCGHDRKRSSRRHHLTPTKKCNYWYMNPLPSTTRRLSYRFSYFLFKVAV